MGCPPVRKIIHSLKLADYLHVQVDNPWYNYYLIAFNYVFYILVGFNKICFTSFISFSVIKGFLSLPSMNINDIRNIFHYLC